MNKLKEVFNQSLNFIGQFDELPVNANLGDICIKDGIIYIYAIDWQELSSTPDLEIEFIRIENEILYLT